MEMRRWLNWDLASTRTSFSESITWFSRVSFIFSGNCISIMTGQQFGMPRLRDDEQFLHNGEWFGERKSKGWTFNLTFIWKGTARPRNADQSFYYCDVWFCLCVHVYSPLWFQYSSKKKKRKEKTQNNHVDKFVCVKKRGVRRWIWSGRSQWSCGQDKVSS